MEKYSEKVRFCMICNHVSNIIPALQSRCTRFKFKKIPIENAWNRVKEIGKYEGMEIREEIAKEIITICEGDMRKIVNLIQSLYLSNQGEELTIESLYQRIGGISPIMVDQIL